MLKNKNQNICQMPLFFCSKMSDEIYCRREMFGSLEYEFLIVFYITYIKISDQNLSELTFAFNTYKLDVYPK